jgi:hypothetical protein
VDDLTGNALVKKLLRCLSLEKAMRSWSGCIFFNSFIPAASGSSGGLALSYGFMYVMHQV